MTKKDKPVYSYVRRGNALLPELEYDTGLLEGVAQGERVRVEIKQWRNTKRNRAYWAMLGEVVTALELPYSAEKLHDLAKMKNGVIELLLLPDGTPIATPGSIAFEKMTEAEFVAFFNKVQKWLAETYGWVSEREAA